MPKENQRKFWITTMLRSGVTVVVAVLVIFTVVKAGSLTPSSPPTSPAATAYTLNDIYTRLTTNATSTAGNHDFAPAGIPAASLRSLTEIYTAIPTISASKVAVGISYLGVTGTLLGNMFNGTCYNTGADATCPLGTEYIGGSQAAGGVEDFNADSNWIGQTPPTNRYATTWTTCNSSTYNATTNPGGNYCNTGDAGANAKDTATGLVWSYPCKGTGCSSWDTTSTPNIIDCPDNGGNCYWNTDTFYTYATSTINSSKTAYQLCSQHSGWSLPHQKQLMQAYIDGSYVNLEPQGVGRYYWSATTVSDNPTYAWYVDLSDGGTDYGTKTNPFNSIRCVRLAN